ncbi:MAG: CarD family transcriptional regulator [Oscillibacter sp.]|jgi:CarD family transcriptional regulator|nr:CarD family transcriptional regulator [Oscillibacter sp.]
MFQLGELVVYGSTGVCRVEDFAGLDGPGEDREKRYYLLKPLWQDGVIYAPMDSEKVPMRPVISRTEAEALIDRMPDIPAAAGRGGTAQAQAQQYQSAVRDGGHEALIKIMKAIRRKQGLAESKNRRLGMVDERYMKQAERLLYGELATALEIPYDEVEDYIAARLEGAAESAEAGA